MPARLPTFNIDEQQKLLKEIQLDTLYPFTYQMNGAINASTYPTVDSTLGSYNTFTFTAPNTMALVAMQISAIISPTSPTLFATLISYSQTIAINSINSQTMPQDSGNDIYRAMFLGNVIYVDFINLIPYNYFLAKGQNLYIHQWANAAIVAAGTSAVFQSVVLHTRPTGLQV